MSSGPRWLYLHGFGSGPSSTKGVEIAAHLASKGVAIERLNLRIPSLEKLRLSAIIDHVVTKLGDESDRAVLIGSSLGGFSAARVAERDARVCALVLLAPAFRFAERWPARLGPEKMSEWRTTGKLEIDDYVEKKKTSIDIGFLDDAITIDARNDGWPDVRVPTLIIHGSRDAVVDVSLSRAWASSRPHVELVEVDDEHELAASLPRIKRECDRFLAPFWAGSSALRNA